ncbi:unnamed protein product [Orchesella dallaii]|uniref:Xaa-Pro aminopeptidase 1 n=1 Tax=Orchesella dallaii TaxID=48710 RepID=A0ABP1S4P1_9HEXA
MVLSVNTTLQLLRLRTLLANLSLAAYIIPLHDGHQGERTPDCNARLKYISGFSGTSGKALVTLSEALFWTDGRYFIQASEEMDKNWKLMKEGIPDEISMQSYMKTALEPRSHIGLDPSIFSKPAWDDFQSSLKNGQVLHPTQENLVDIVWGEERPACSKRKLIQIPVEFTGKETAEKLQEIREKMKERRAQALVINQLDDIAWLLNLRGFDISAAAVFLSFAIIKPNDFDLFIDQSKLDENILNSLKKDGGFIFNYEDINHRLESLVSSTNGTIWLAKTCSFSLTSIVPEPRQLIDLSPLVLLKAVKNPTEIKGYKNALTRDSAILARFYSWLENSIETGENVTELSASDYLLKLRREHEYFLTTSFETISASDSSGASPHYSPTPLSNKPITKNSMFLFDAGAIYLDGTTDITRTFHFGTPTDHQREAYTRVLKGQIALATIIFPQRTLGYRLDSFARMHLWNIGLDYGHGTGHGVGIDVHEVPTKISYNHLKAPDDRGFVENMLTSNEPGYYEQGSFGIRLENIVRVVNSTVKDPKGNPFLAIEDMTFLPYQHKLIKKELLTHAEVEYLNTYQEKCRQVVGEFIKQHYPGDQAYQWIIKETKSF